MDQLLNIGQLEFLTRLGREEETVDILGTKFFFKTLTVEESTQAFEAPVKQNFKDDLAKFNAFRIEVLTKAILQINTLVIPDHMRDKVKALLQRSQQVVINKLFDAYQELLDKQGKKFTTAESDVEKQVPAASVPIAENVTSPIAPRPPATVVNWPTTPPAVQEQTPTRIESLSQTEEEPDESETNIIDPSTLMGPKK